MISSPFFRPFEERKILHKKTDLTQIFQGLGGDATLLILGEPGGGKTTMMLEIVEKSIEKSHEAIKQGFSIDEEEIPIVLSLSSWNINAAKTGLLGLQPQRYEKLKDWLIRELETKYQVPLKTGKKWIEKESLILFLDGLDEVSSEFRNKCIDAINEFKQEHGKTKIVVCSRSRDYEALESRLQFQSSLYICPLTIQYIQSYLRKAGSRLKGVRAALQVDIELQEKDPDSMRRLAETPLFLSIMLLTYEGVAASTIKRMGVLDHRKKLFINYVERMFKHRRENPKYPREKVKYWLSSLSRRMTEETFFVEEIQPLWLLDSNQKRPYKLGEAFYCSLFSILLIYILQNLSWTTKLLIFVICFVVLYLSADLRGIYAWGRNGGRSVEKMKKNIKSFSILRKFLTKGDYFYRLLVVGLSSLFGIYLGLGAAMSLTAVGTESISLTSLSVALMYETTDRICLSISLGLLGGLIFGYLGWCTYLNSKLFLNLKTYQGFGFFLGESNPPYFYFCLTASLSMMFVFYIFILVNPNAPLSAVSIDTRRDEWLLFVRGLPLISKFMLGYIGLTIMPFMGMIVNLIFILRDVLLVRYFVLRVSLCFLGITPWHYVRFLDYAVDHIFLQKVGSGYIFIHRLLREYFGGLENKL